MLAIGEGARKASRNMNGPKSNISACAVAIGAFAALGIMGVWLWRYFGPSTYIRIPTKFGTARIFQVADDDGSPVRLLEVGGIVQSGTYIDERYAELVFEYLKLYDLMFEADRPIERVCVLGCGGYDYPEHLIAHHPGVTVDAVEIDPAITALAQRYFFLDRIIEEYDTEKTRRLNLICDDALSHLLTSDKCYDAIVNDTFDAGSPPPHLTTRRFAAAVHARLKPGGLFLTNIVSPLVGSHTTFLDEQVEILETVFSQVKVYPCANDTLAEDDNVIVVATK